MKPLVFVHGFMGGSAQWALQDSLSSIRDLHFVDLPGFGKNADLPPIDRIPNFAAWVLDEMIKIGVHRFDLLGHSMGGMIVQEMVKQAPDRVQKLVLYGTGPSGILPGRFETVETSMERARQDGPKATARRVSATWFLDYEKAAEYPACAEIAECSTLPSIIAGLEAMKAWDGVDHLEKITQQTLILAGDTDRSYQFTETEKLWTKISNSELAVVPRCAHAVHLERPAIFNLILADFLQRD